MSMEQLPTERFLNGASDGLAASGFDFRRGVQCSVVTAALQCAVVVLGQGTDGQTHWSQLDSCVASAAVVANGRTENT